MTALAVAASLFVVACGGSDGSSASTTSEPSPTTTAPESTVASTIPTATPTVAATTTAPSTSTTTPPTTPSPSTTPPAGACDVVTATGLLDATVAMARLAAGGEWTDDAPGGAFDERTDTAAEFGRMTGYDCARRLEQRSSAGAERLALISWNDLRHSIVVQATDAPSEPYAGEARFQLFIEQPDGEWLVDQSVWAATMSGGETIIVAVHDASIGLTAKSWQAAVPPFEDLPVTLAAERYGIDALRAAGARLVSVAEPASFGWEIGAIQFHTPLALAALADVGPTTVFDPMVPIVADGTSSTHEVDDIELRVTTGLELDMFVLHEVGFRCGDFGWRLTSTYGTPGELLDFAATLVRSIGCS